MVLNTKKTRTHPYQRTQLPQIKNKKLYSSPLTHRYSHKELFGIYVKNKNSQTQRLKRWGHFFTEKHFVHTND